MPQLRVASASASSTLDGDEDAHGPLALLRGGADECWRSGGGGGAWLALRFASPVALRALELAFAGGFVGTPLGVDVAAAADADGADAAGWARVGAFAPTDSNEPQRFDLPAAARGVRAVRLVFAGSSDFYGRVVLYRAAAFGDDGDG